MDEQGLAAARAGTMARQASVERRTNETAVRARLCLAEGNSRIETGIGFLDHMIHQLVFHAGWSLELDCSGDLPVDDHHSAEDCALVLGQCLKQALRPTRVPASDKASGESSSQAASRIERFGSAYAPMDESLARAVVDFSGRPGSVVRLGTVRERIGQLACENLVHFVRSFAQSAGATIHVEVLYGDNDHHKAEAAFKALALALRCAVACRPAESATAGPAGYSGGMAASTKGVQ